MVEDLLVLEVSWLISTSGCLLSVGRALSLLGVTPAGSQLSRYSHRSLRTFRSKQLIFNLFVFKNLSLRKIFNYLFKLMSVSTLFPLQDDRFPWGEH